MKKICLSLVFSFLTILAFSVDKNQKLPPSLKNIFKEIKNDVGVENETGNLTKWAKQGVLLLNSSLTVVE